MQKLRRQHPFVLATGTPGQSWKNIVLQSSQTSADCWTNSMWHLLLMQKSKKAHHQHTNMKTSLFLKHMHKKSKDQESKPTVHWGLCRNTEVRGAQTFPSLLHPTGVLHYFHFTNNLRTVAQDAGSGGAMERASFQNRETDICLSLERDRLISEQWPLREERGKDVMLNGGWTVAVQ